MSLLVWSAFPSFNNSIERSVILGAMFISSPSSLSSLFNIVKIWILISIQGVIWISKGTVGLCLIMATFEWRPDYWSINSHSYSPLCRLLICMLSSSDCKLLVPLLLGWNTLECIELCARSFPFADEGEKLHICTSVHLFCVFGGAFYFPCPMATSFSLPLSVWLVSWVPDNCCYYSFGVFAQPNSRDTVAFCVHLSPLQGSVAFGNDRHVYLFIFAQ